MAAFYDIANGSLKRKERSLSWEDESAEIETSAIEAPGPDTEDRGSPEQMTVRIKNSFGIPFLPV
jgi:hypothetical protein